MIDDPGQVAALMAKLKASLPLQVEPSPELVKLSRQNGWAIAPKQRLTIGDVRYMSDMGGISCEIQSIAGDKEVLLVSLTHLKFDSTHPLAAEVEAYQQRRVRGIALQNSRGFAEQLMSRERSVRRKRGKGFGK